MTDSQIIENAAVAEGDSASAYGGGVLASPGTITNSTIKGNVVNADYAADGSGVTLGGEAVIENTTVTANIGQGANVGGAVNGPDVLTVTNSTVTNNSGVSTGAFSSAITFQNATVTSTTCITSSIANGAAGGGGSSVATCTGSSLAAAEVLTVTTQLVANNTASGADILPTVSIPGLGISTPGTSVQVDEVGLDKTGGTLVTGNAHAIVVGYVTFRPVLAALAGRPHAWNKLTRRKSVNPPPPNSQLPGQLAYVD